MARNHGSGSRLFVDLAGGGSASLVAYLTKWTADFATDKIEDTALGDTNKQYLAGLRDSKGTFAGWYDDASPQTYTAAADGIARKTYLYPNFVATPGQYWYGTALFDFNVAGGIAELLSISGSFAAASPFAKVG